MRHARNAPVPTQKDRQRADSAADQPGPAGVYWAMVEQKAPEDRPNYSYVITDHPADT